MIIPSIQLPKKSISVSPQGKVMLSLHVCVKNFNFENVKLHSFQQVSFCFRKLCHSKVQKDNFDVILEKYVVISVHVFSKLHIFTKMEIKILLNSLPCYEVHLHVEIKQTNRMIMLYKYCKNKFPRIWLIIYLCGIFLLIRIRWD